ncbi:MAG: redoxin domain-containing protein [Verrucomicrobiota bacterium]
MKFPSILSVSLASCVALTSMANAQEVKSAESKSAPAAKAPAGTPEGVADLKIGDTAPDFTLLGIDDQKHSLSEYKDAEVLMVAFISNHCPDSHAAEGRMMKLIADMKGKSFKFVAINPNNPDGLSIDELGYSKYNDGFDDMKRYAKDSGFNFPYLYDGDTQSVAKAYGCLATPHVFVFDANRKLRYKGQFDDSRFEDAATVKSPDARNAVEALLAGKSVPLETTKPHGCSTKWLGKKELVAEKMEKWDHTPVDVELIDTDGVAALRKNGTKKVRLFNVWATWCGPCVAEFPELVTTARKFGLRDFEMITISNDTPDTLPKVKSFLEKRGAGLSAKLQASVKAEGRTTNSYVYSGASVNDLMKVLDPEWPGAIPHTVLVGTNGEIVWRHNGPVDGEELRSKILNYLGAYYKPQQ